MGAVIPDRRQFLQSSLALAGFGLLSGCGLLADRVRQSERVPVIGYLSLGSSAESADSVDAFRQGLGELGYVEGQSITIEY